MKFNKWTLGLAAVGVVSLASAARAEELSPVSTAVSGTTISGVVDVGYQRNIGDVRRNPVPTGSTFSDGFHLNQVIISLDKALETDKPWAAGYHIDLNYGDAAIKGNAPIRQAFVALNTPVGNGIDWKVGVMDGVTGYEGNTLANNPNFTHSYAYGLNPDQLVGAIGKYGISDTVSLKAGIVNRVLTNGGTNTKRQENSYVFGVSLTAPDNLGFLKGSTLNLATIQGFDNQSVANYSADLTLATPVAGVKFGFAFDAVQSSVDSTDGQVYGVYATYQATEKLGVALRGEYLNGTDLSLMTGTKGSSKGEAITATVSYNLWQNVVSRVELRWDHIEHGTGFYQDNYSNAFLIAANIAYKF